MHERAYMLVVDGEVEIDHDGEHGRRRAAGSLAHFAPNERRTIRAITRRAAGAGAGAVARRRAPVGGVARRVGPRARTGPSAGGCREPARGGGLAGARPDHVFAPGADADQRDRDADELGHELEVLARGGRAGPTRSGTRRGPPTSPGAPRTRRRRGGAPSGGRGSGRTRRPPRRGSGCATSSRSKPESTSSLVIASAVSVFSRAA